MTLTNAHHVALIKAREIADEAVEDAFGVELGSYALNSRTAEYWTMVFQATAMSLVQIDRMEKGIY
jgi:hypothetical protein